MGMRLRPASLPKKVDYIRYQLNRGNTQGIHPLALDFESKVLRGEACARAAEQLAREGFQPEIICVHPGWGESLFLADVWKEASLLSYQEFYYQWDGVDLGFDPEFETDNSFDKATRSRIKNAPVLLGIEASSWCVTPTQFQLETFPPHIQDKISVIHDGINTNVAQPAQTRKPLALSTGLQLDAAQPVVTFVNRTLEPYRGCHSFIRAIPELQKLIPGIQTILVGSLSGISYGKKCAQGEWHERFFFEIRSQYDPASVHLTGALSYQDYITVLKHSSAHVYLTYPFVVSWSLLEAMSCACPIVGSNTAPVQEFVSDGVNGLIVDFFKPKEIAAAVAEMIKNPSAARKMGHAARERIVRNYSLAKCLPRQRALIELVANKTLSSFR